MNVLWWGLAGLGGLLGLVGLAGLARRRERPRRRQGDPLADYPFAKERCTPNADNAHTPLMLPKITPEQAGLTRPPAEKTPPVAGTFEGSLAGHSHQTEPLRQVDMPEGLRAPAEPDVPALAPTPERVLPEPAAGKLIPTEPIPEMDIPVSAAAQHPETLLHPSETAEGRHRLETPWVVPSAPMTAEAPLAAEAPAGHVAPMEAEAPMRSAAPMDSEVPAGTAAPVDAAVPAGAAAPMGYEVPAGTAAPVDAAVPERPAAPVEPGAPAQPVAPMDTEVPAHAAAPMGAESPAGTAAPMGPEVPARTSAEPENPEWTAAPPAADAPAWSSAQMDPARTAAPMEADVSAGAAAPAESEISARSAAPMRTEGPAWSAESLEAPGRFDAPVHAEASPPMEHEVPARTAAGAEPPHQFDELTYADAPVVAEAPAQTTYDEAPEWTTASAGRLDVPGSPEPEAPGRFDEPVYAEVSERAAAQLPSRGDEFGHAEMPEQAPAPVGGEPSGRMDAYAQTPASGPGWADAPMWSEAPGEAAPLEPEASRRIDALIESETPTPAGMPESDYASMQPEGSEWGSAPAQASEQADVPMPAPAQSESFADAERFEPAAQAEAPSRVDLTGQTDASDWSEYPVQAGSPEGFDSSARVEAPERFDSAGQAEAPVWGGSPVQEGSPGRVDAAAQAEAPGRFDSAGRVEAPERSEYPVQAGSPEGFDSSARVEAPERFDSAGQAGSPDWSEYPVQTGSLERFDSPAQAEEPGLPDSFGQAETPISSGSPGQAGSLGRFDAAGHAEAPGRSDSSAQAEAPDSSESSRQSEALGWSESPGASGRGAAEEARGVDVSAHRESSVDGRGAEWLDAPGQAARPEPWQDGEAQAAQERGMWSEPADGHRLVGPPVEAESAQAHDRDEAQYPAGWAQPAELRSRMEAREAHAPTPVDAAAQTWMQAPAEPYTRDRNEGRHRLEEATEVEIPAPAVSPEQAEPGEDSQHPVRKAVSRLKTKVPDSVGEVVRKFRR